MRTKYALFLNFLIAVLFVANTAKSQIVMSCLSGEERIGISFSSGIWATAAPFHTAKLFGNASPAYTIGVERYLLRGERFEYSQNFNIGYNHHSDFNNNFYFNTESAFSVKTDFGLYFQAVAGMGYLTYVYGEYRTPKEDSDNYLIPSAGVAVGINSQNYIGSRWGVFAKYNVMPLFPIKSANTSLTIGVKLFPF